MIKLIATDMDGTLLDENGYLPQGFTDILNRLIAKKHKISYR
ncbi:hydroxymethylpyrimidine pyrophosphatase-like HAD family hydrolase [Clostridium saccharobutylicum]|nr:hydroxymethylpyrimidine pyrophosphatase-like HAD family hydrolase [Clostridium saccharobutylicum]